MRVTAAIRRGVVLAAVAGITTVGLGATAITADAVTVYKGKVTANGGLAIRQAPSTHTGGKGSIAKGKTIKIDCKAPGTKVGGNRLWYALSGDKGWVSARYVDNIGAAPRYCPPSDTEYGDGLITEAVNLRSGPHFNDAKTGTLQAGKRVVMVCYVKSSAGVSGNYRWYLLDNDSWVTAAYVKRLSTPGTNLVGCTE